MTQDFVSKNEIYHIQIVPNYGQEVEEGDRKIVCVRMNYSLI